MVGNGDGFTHTHIRTHPGLALIEWNAITCWMSIVHWFHLNEGTHKPDSARLRQAVAKNVSSAFAHNFAYFLLVRLTQIQYNTIDWFDKSERSPDTLTHTHTLNCAEKPGRHNCITNSRTSEQYPNHWSSFIIITIDVCLCDCFWFSVESLLLGLFLHKILIIYWVSEWVCVGYSHESQWSMEQIHGSATRKTRLKGNSLPCMRCTSVLFCI